MATGIQTDGTYVRKGLTAIITDLENNAKSLYGTNVDLLPGSPLKRFINATALEIDAQEQRIEDIYYAPYIATATKSNLDNLLALINLVRKAATKSTGAVTFGRATAPATPITIPAGTLIATAGGIQFTTNADGTITSPATSVNVNATAVLAGVNGNVAGATITRFSSVIPGIETVTNSAAFAGGSDLETDEDFRARALQSLATSGRATRDAIRSGLLAVSGVSQATVFENDGVASDKTQTFFDNDVTGTATENVDGTTAKIAYRFFVEAGKRYFLQHLKAKTTTGSGTPTYNVRVETDSSGSPSGTLIDSRYLLNNWIPTSTVLSESEFPLGQYISGGTSGLDAWAVYERTAGTATFDGSAINGALTNGGFETYTTTPGAPDNWTSLAGTGLVLAKETTIIRTGANSVKVTSGGTTNQGLYQTLPALTTGRFYFYEAYARTAGVAGEQAAVQIWNSTDNLLVFQKLGTAATTTFERLQVYFKAEAGKTYQLRLVQAEPTASTRIVYFDDAAQVTTVKVNAGSWAASSNVGSLNSEVVAGVPPAGIRCLVNGGTDAAVAQSILDYKAAGIEAYGQTTANAVDLAGVAVPVYFDRPTTRTIYITVNSTGGNATAIETAVIKYIGGTDASNNVHKGLGVGDDVIFIKIAQAVAAVPAVATATITLGFSPSPLSSADLVIGLDELARATTASVVVNVT